MFFYNRAGIVILQDLPDFELHDDQQDVIEKVVVAMNLRATSLSSLDGPLRPSKDDMELLITGFYILYIRYYTMGLV